MAQSPAQAGEIAIGLVIVAAAGAQLYPPGITIGITNCCLAPVLGSDLLLGPAL